MALPQLEYVRPGSLEEVAGALAARPDARLLLGGTDLLVQLGRLPPQARATVVDLKRVAGLSEIVVDADGLHIGAAVTLSDLCRHPHIAAAYPLLCQACRSVGSTQIQNRATLTGNICNASPAADTAPALLVLDAEVECLAGNGKRRRLPIEGFFVGPKMNALARGEWVIAVHLPAATAGASGRYRKLSRRRSVDLATVGVAVGRLAVPAGGGQSGLRIALGAVAPTPLRVHAAEEELRACAVNPGTAKAIGQAGEQASDRSVEQTTEQAGDQAIDRAGEQAGDQAVDGTIEQAIERAVTACLGTIHPISDLRGSAEYRREMVGVLVRRGLRELLSSGGPA